MNKLVYSSYILLTQKVMEEREKERQEKVAMKRARDRERWIR